MKTLWQEYRLIVIYLIFGGLWILFSDRAIMLLTQNPQEITLLQTYKGWGFIVITAFLLLLMMIADNKRRKKILADLKKAKEAAENAERVKSSFMSNMSHEVRSPMNVIVGFSELLRDPGISDNQKDEYIESIQKAGFHLVDLITNMVDASDLHVQQTELVNSSFNLNDLFDELRLEAESMLENYNNTKTKIRVVESLERNESFIIADYGKLSRAIYHLIQNAVKNTPEGFIEIGYDIIEGDKIRLYVRDTGVGIPENRQPHIFEAFSKSNGRLEPSQGAGLGLNIVKGFVEIMEGDITFNSIPGEGTVIGIILTLNRDIDRIDA